MNCEEGENAKNLKKRKHTLYKKNDEDIIGVIKINLIKQYT